MVRPEREPARGLHSNVTLNLTAKEAVALENLLPEVPHSWTDAVAAVAKVRAAAERACTPWSERV